MNLPDPHPITNITDVNILMHREAHFGGSFPLMLDYYRKEGVGCSEEFTIQQIEALAEAELKMGENLASLNLTGADAEKIGRIREAYKALKDLYNVQNPTSVIPTLIADLILSEELEPTEEINAIIDQKRAAIPALLDLIRSDDFHDPLFPGYGRAPEMAAKCLGKIGNESAIAALFESIRENEFFEDDASFEALKWIGKPARDFLLSIVKSLPITVDNERAAIALIQFDKDPEISKTCLEILKKIDFNKYLPFATYLILCCSDLQDPEDQKAFKALKVPSMLEMDIKVISSNW